MTKLILITLFVLITVSHVLSKRHGRKGAHMQGPKSFMHLGKEADAIMCKQENLNDDKLDKFRAEIELCNIDDCAAQADDISSAVHKSENKLIARMKCSPKYRTCRKELIKQFKDENGKRKEPSEDMKKAWVAKKVIIF